MKNAEAVTERYGKTSSMPNPSYKNKSAAHDAHELSALPHVSHPETMETYLSKESSSSIPLSGKEFLHPNDPGSSNQYSGWITLEKPSLAPVGNEIIDQFSKGFPHVNFIMANKSNG
jgi:hypothetical protein